METDANVLDKRQKCPASATLSGSGENVNMTKPTGGKTDLGSLCIIV